MTEQLLVPSDFEIPDPPDHPLFRFEPLGPEHNAADLDAWSSSIDHIHATPGFRPDGWPERRYTLAENLADLERHRDHHLRYVDFAWTARPAGRSARDRLRLPQTRSDRGSEGRGAIVDARRPGRTGSGTARPPASVVRHRMAADHSLRLTTGSGLEGWPCRLPASSG
ncbi:MAG TPA: hypothetical protein VFL65_07515 [Jatrophihabitans sp.]|nr:hypothetical protein [Jatrophihabitans sp.]